MMWSVLRFLCVCLTALVSATFIGYQSLLPILEDEKLFASLCQSDESLPCIKQLLQLDSMYQLSVSASYISYLFFSFICLKYGPRISILTGGLLQTIACIIFSFGYDWHCYFSFIAIGIGSAGIILGIIGIPSQYSPAYQGILYSLIIACIDASSGITYIFLLLHNKFDISLQTLYMSLSICILITCLVSFFFVFSKYFIRNTTRYDTMDVNRVMEGFDNINYNTNDSNDKNDNYTGDTEGYASISSEQMVGFTGIHFSSAWTDTFCSAQFGAILIWSLFYMTAVCFYITTLEQQLKWITNDEDEVLFGEQLFSIMLLSNGICVIITGPIIDLFGQKFALIMMAMISFITCISSNIRIYDLQLSITMIAFVLNRFFYFTMTPLLIVKIFGAAKQQFIYGIVLFLSAFVSLFGILFDYMAQEFLKGNYTIFNLIIGVCCIVATLWLVFVLRYNPLVS